MIALKNKNRDKLISKHTQQGNTQQGPTQQRPTQQGPTQQRPTQQGPIQQWPIQWPIQQGHTQQGPIQQGPIQQGHRQQWHIQQGHRQQLPIQQRRKQQGHKLAFIHIGKSGGTTINKLLSGKVKYREYHLHKDFQNNEKYIIWLRNPISRFCSAFNHSYYAVHTDLRSIRRFDLDNCLLPEWMEGAIKRSYVFSFKYDFLIKEFSSANHLAESLTSENNIIQKKAKELMNSDIEHLNAGIGWHLNNGKFVENNNDKILFVGTLENMDDDISALSKKLNIGLTSNLHLRENVYLDKSMKYLSPLAIKNIIDWYKHTDYAALHKLYNYGWITKGILDSYYTYNTE